MTIKAISNIALPLQISNLSVTSTPVVGSESTLEQIDVSFAAASTDSSYSATTIDIDMLVTVTGSGYFFSGIVTALYNGVDGHEATFNVSKIHEDTIETDYSFTQTVLDDDTLEAQDVIFSGKSYNFGKDKSLSVSIDFFDLQTLNTTTIKAKSSAVNASAQAVVIKAVSTVEP